MRYIFLYYFCLGCVMLGLLVMFSGCTPTTIIKPQDVKVPIAVSCAPDLPPEPVWQIPIHLSDTHANKVKALAQDLDAAKGYIGVLEAALLSCK